MSAEWRWQRSRAKDGCLVFRLRRSYPQIERLATRALLTEDELDAELLRLAARPLDADDAVELPSRPADPKAEAAVEHLAVEVGEAAEAKRWTFVADVDEHAVFAPSGRRLLGGWAPFVARLRDRGIPLDRLRDGDVPIRNARGEITVRRRRIEGV